MESYLTQVVQPFGDSVRKIGNKEFCKWEVATNLQLSVDIRYDLRHSFYTKLNPVELTLLVWVNLVLTALQACKPHRYQAQSLPHVDSTALFEVRRRPCFWANPG